MKAVFRHAFREGIRHVRHDCASQRWSVFAAMHFGDLGTFDTRKVHLSPIPPLTALTRFICRVDRERGRTWGTFFPLKQRLSEPRSHAWNVAEWVEFSIFSLAKSRESRARACFSSHFSLAPPGAVYAGEPSQVRPTAKGGDVARKCDTRKHLPVQGTRWDWNFNESKTSVPHEESRSRRLSWAV